MNFPETHSAAVNLLSTRGLSRNFGGLMAVDAIDFDLGQGEIRAIIGPNGAGKTTFVNLISGRIKPSSGQIRFEGRDITGLADHARVGLGIAYTFQITSVFENLSCYDNVALAVQHALRRGGQRVSKGSLDRGVADALARVDLAIHGGTLASALAYGHKRLLEVAIGLALKPKLLILDEPTQGLSDPEIVNFCALCREIARHATLLLIEHNMAVVMQLADRITVLDQGQILAEGGPAEIRDNQAVQKAYLGS